MQKKALLSTFAAAATVSMLVACGPAPTQTPDPSASPSANPSAAPSVEPSAEPTAGPSAEPTAGPTASPSAEPTATPTADPSASATPTPLPSATSDISVIETTTFNGKVFDDSEAPMDGVTITAKSLNSSVPFEATTTTAGGTYSFNNAPSGVQIEIVASRSGFTTRKRVEVLKSNKQGDPNANKYDFGTDGSNAGGSGSASNALSDKPEVIAVTPGRNAAGVDPKTSFVIKFSEPVDRNSVEDNFVVRVQQDQKLSVDRKNTFTFGGGSASNSSNTTVNPSSSIVWDESDFTASWNSDDTEVTFTFADEKLLPTDKDSDKVPDYLISFNNKGGSIKDKSGVLRPEKWFKLTEGNFETYYKFAIRTDESKPSVSSVIATSREGGSLRGDSIKVRFSERMLIDTKSVDIASSSFNDVVGGAFAADSILNPANYTITVSGSGVAPNNSYTWGALKDRTGASVATNSGVGAITFDADDLTRKTVILLPPGAPELGASGSSVDLFNRSDVIKVEVSSGVVDPAGNTMESRSTDKTTTAG